MKTKIVLHTAYLLLLFPVVLFLAGCASVSIPVSMVIPGELKLTDVSKIAIADFNTLENDPFAGVVSASPEALVFAHNAVKSAFYKTRTFDVTDLDAENMVVSTDKNSNLKKRFDAIIYGRVWWQMTPETFGMEPHVFDLTSWRYVNWTHTVNVLGKETQVTEKVKVTTQDKQELEMLDYRQQTATLMLSLSIYRVRQDGSLEKIADTCQVAHQTELMYNGSFKAPVKYLGPKDRRIASQFKTGRTHDAAESRSAVKGGEAVDRFHDANGAVIFPKNMESLPTKVQAEMMLVSSAASDLVKRLTPTKEVFDIYYVFDDPKLQGMVGSGAYEAAEKYAEKKIRMALGKEYAAHIPPLEAYDAPDYEVPATTEDDRDDVESDGKFQQEEFEELIRDKELAEPLFTLGLCQEATGRVEQAMYTYRYAFQILPEDQTASCIARCYLAIGQDALVREARRDAKKAARKTRLD